MYLDIKIHDVKAHGPAGRRAPTLAAAIKGMARSVGLLPAAENP